jgi:hypothetical protein
MAEIPRLAGDDRITARHFMPDEAAGHAFARSTTSSSTTKLQATMLEAEWRAGRPATPVECLAARA